ncbi:YlzJ-like family protein [Pontibacillus yanchengensis]|uniref:Uncharacterized protein n=1 Tax=Pontibacillus yanchengensis Y32 TaxID=1385514 RepID=A0A0A2TCH8_9BACI|nr:YlzJ-like family protein [Pontibacillus yanchengensis]KGP73537.1 hypothetical protein N782_04780 [Pontibacillus yanchengensis Y32]
MIHYTPLSEFDIIEDDPSSYENNKIISLKGRTMKVQKMDDGNFQITQLLSTDPQDYLDTDFIPGTILSLQDFQE